MVGAAGLEKNPSHGALFAETRLLGGKKTSRAGTATPRSATRRKLLICRPISPA
jgi:hypothetical protein